MKLTKNKQEYTGDEAYIAAQEQGYPNPGQHPFVKETYKKERVELERIHAVGDATLRLVELNGVLVPEDEAKELVKSL